MDKFKMRTLTHVCTSGLVSMLSSPLFPSLPPPNAEEAPAAEDEDQTESILSDSDDCIVPGQSSMGRKIVSQTLRPESRAAADSSVVRLFVEYFLLDIPSEKTPLSLPKPPPGKTSHYNYSNVIHVDIKNNKTRRVILRGVLEGRNPQMERIPNILEQQQDLIETSLNIVDVQDSSVGMGSLCVCRGTGGTTVYHGGPRP